MDEEVVIKGTHLYGPSAQTATLVSIEFANLPNSYSIEPGEDDDTVILTYHGTTLEELVSHKNWPKIALVLNNFFGMWTFEREAA